MDGILVINKPLGLTSHQVVNRVRQITGQRRVGHAGTLDPLATGVLLVCLGQATRLTEYLMGSDKVYCAEIILGATTDTYDAWGQRQQSSPVKVTIEEIQDALRTFVGQIEQVPPPYSAIKRGGQPLYRAARRGEQAVATPRQVLIYDIRLIAWQPPALVIQVHCSKGTYIRSLAHDLGQRLGCGAYLNALVRLKSGRFTLEEAITLDDLTLAMEEGYLDRFLYAPDEAVLDALAVILGPEREARVRKGQGMMLAVRESALSSLMSADDDKVKAQADEIGRSSPSPSRSLCRAYNLAGEFLAVGYLDTQVGWWQPEKVFSTK